MYQPAINMRVLVVEDNSALLAVMQSYVEEVGCKFSLVTSGEAAIEAVQDRRFDLIVMDVELEGPLNGFEATAEIRKILVDDWIPIIFTTSRIREEDYELGIECGGDDYITKPLSRIIFQTKLRAMARIADMRREQIKANHALQKLNAELKALSFTDPLTKIYNRRAFMEMGEQSLALAARNVNPVSMIMIDIDYFKLYNDHYGHVNGDSCLKKIAKALNEVVNRACDIVARYGGEEFIIFLGDTDLEGAEKVAGNIKALFEDLAIPHKVSPICDYVTACVGVVNCTSAQSQNIPDMINAADKNLYHAKEAGRNQYYSSNMRSNKTILLVDDDKVFSSLWSEYLKELGEVLTANSGDECLDIANEKLPDIILLDINMPGMDGYETCEALKRNPKTAHIPVIFISGTPSSELKNIKNNYIDKNITNNIASLLGQVSKHLTD